jgi:hypothetical protein
VANSEGQPAPSSSSVLERSRRRLRAAGRLPLALIGLGVTGLVLVLATASPSSAAPTVLYAKGAAPGCSVELALYDTYATAMVSNGCQGPDYWMAVWQARSDVYSTSFPQVLFASTNHAPWTLAYPLTSPCYVQVDFSYRSAPPGEPTPVHQVIAAGLRSTSCPPPTTTTTQPGGTTTTTQPGGTTTTTQPGGTTTTTQPGGTTTTGPGSGGSGGGGATTTTEPATTTTTVVHLTGSGGGPPVYNSPSAGGAAGESAPGGLAFTGFAAMLLAFIAMTLIGAGLAVVRTSRLGHIDALAGVSPE